MAQPSGKHDLDTRLLRFRGRPGAEDPVRLAADLLSAERAHEAAEVTTLGLRVSPDDAALLILDGRAHAASGDLLKAQAALLKAARVAPQDKTAFRWLGEVLLKRGDPQRAAKVLERARALDPSDRDILALTARAERLARIALSEGGSNEPLDPDDKTQARPEFASRLASETAPRRDARPPLRANAEVAKAAPEVDDDEEDQPTRAMDRALVEEALSSSAPPAAGSREPRVPGARPGPPIPARRATLPLKSSLPQDSATLPPGAPRPSRMPTRTLDRVPEEIPSAPPPTARMPAVEAPRSAPPGRGSVQAPTRAPAPPPIATRSEPSSGSPKSNPGLVGASPIAESQRVSSSPAPRPSALPRIPASYDDDSDEISLPSSGEGTPGTLMGTPTAWNPDSESQDLPLGNDVDGRPDVDQVLALLRAEGIFESTRAESPGWAGRKEARPERTKIGIWLGAAWVLAIGAGVGVWFGWQEWVDRRHRNAESLVEQARSELAIGDHERLVDAERHLREARELNPRAVGSQNLLLVVHAQRALEDGAFEVGYLRPTIARAERLGGAAHQLAMARAVLSAGESDIAAARNAMRNALEGEGAEDAEALYVVGRLEQRLGEEEAALAHLEAAVERDGSLSAPAIALAEARYDHGRPEDAMALLERVLTHDDRNLRAQLWKAFLRSADVAPEEGLRELAGLDSRLDRGAPTDRVLASLTKARLLRRQGTLSEAAAEVEHALAAGAQEPRLLALLARAARTSGKLAEAEFAANAAVRASPSNVDFRKLLASVQLDRRNGRSALSSLSQLPASDPEVLVMTGRAALLVDTDQALEAAKAALDAYIEEHEDAGVEVRALGIRLGMRVADPASMRAPARQLVRDNPGDPIANLTLGELSLVLRDADAAESALSQAAQASPEDADIQWMLGRARRMKGDAAGAEAAFTRALELRPEHADAKLALASLLLDMGEYTRADALDLELSNMAGSASGVQLALAGRLGRVQALIGLGRIEDAVVQLESVRGEDRDTPSARIVAATLALARHRAGDALRELRPLVPDSVPEGTPPPSPTTVALYGEALLAVGEHDAAKAAFDRALATDSGLPEALLGRAELEVKTDHAREAAPWLERAATALQARIRPPHVRGRARLLEGRVLLESGNHESALGKLREAVELAPTLAEAHFFSGEALRASGDNEGAEHPYRRYLELAPTGAYAARARRNVR